jgi:TonB family protein
LALFLWGIKIRLLGGTNVLRTIILTVLVIFPGMSLLAQESDQASMLFTRADEYLQSENYTEAIKEFKKAIKLRPNWAEAYFKLGEAHSRIPTAGKDGSAHRKAAIEAFQKAIELKPTWAEAHQELGSRFLASGNYQDAVGSFKEAIRLKPGVAEMHKDLAIGHLYQAQYDEGIESLKDAIRINPNLARAHLLLGLAYVAVENRDQARQQYDILTSLDSEMANTLLGAIQRPEKFTFGVARGRLISTPKPEYPAAARINRITGRVTVHLVIDAQGKVTSAQAVSGPSELRRAAEAAALKARFEPTRLSGTPVSVNGVISYDFYPQ